MDFVIRSPDHWHQLRQDCAVTASAVGALICDHPYESRLSVYLRAIGELPSVDPIGAAESDWGHDAELMIPARVRRKRPDLQLRKADIFCRHETLPLGATPDFFDQYGGVWQAKCVDPRVYYRGWQEEPPLWILVQHQCEYLCSGRDYGGIVCLVRDAQWSTHVIEVPPHPGTLHAIEDAVGELALRIERREPPRPDYERDARLLMELNRHAKKGRVVDMTGDNYLASLAQRYMLAGEQKTRAEIEQDAAKAEIFEKIGDAAKVAANGFSIAAPEVAALADRTVTADMVGQTLKGRRGYRRLLISETA